MAPSPSLYPAPPSPSSCRHPFLPGIILSPFLSHPPGCHRLVPYFLPACQLPVHRVLPTHQLVKEGSIKHRASFPPFLSCTSISSLLGIILSSFLSHPNPPCQCLVLYFIHACLSCHLEPGWFDEIRRAVADGDLVKWERGMRSDLEK